VKARAHPKVDTVIASHVGTKGSQIVLDFDSSAEGADCVLFGAFDFPEEGHDTIAKKLVDATAVCMDPIEHHVECLVHDRPHVFGIEALGHRRKSANIEEEHGRLFAFAPNGHDRAARTAELLLGSDRLLAEAAPGSDCRLWRIGEPSGRGYCCHRLRCSQATCHT
jgi:hypothetical protein